MKKTPYTVLLVLTVVSLALPNPARAQGTDQLPVVRVGTVSDGANKYLSTEIRNLIEREVFELTHGEFDVRFPKSKQLQADWSVAGVNTAIDKLLADREVDMVIALGVLGSNELARRTRLPKPVIAPFIIDREIQALPFKDGASGVKNLSYLTFPGDVQRDLRRFRELVRFKTLGLFYQQEMMEAIPALRQKAMQAASNVGADVRFIPVGTSANAALTAIPNDVDAVYLPPLVRLSQEEFEILINGLIKRQLPSFALLGRTDVERGVLAGVAPAVELDRSARRVALNLQRILLGEDAGTLPVSLPLRERLTINMRTARAIGFSPSFRMMRTADLLFEQVPAKRRLSLDNAVREAVQANLDIKVAQQTVAAGEQDIRQARSALFPQLDLLGDGVHIDDKRAAVIPGQAENTTSGSLALNQIIYSEPTFANISVQRSLQRSRESQRDTVRGNIVLGAANAYLDVLRAKTTERIAKDNVDLSLQNLELAKLRRQIGTASPAEVFRWQSAVATSRGILVIAEARTRVAKIALNRLLHRPLDERFATTEVGLDDPALITSRQSLIDMIDDPRSFATFSNFMVEEGLAASPELREIQAGIDAQQRTLKSSKAAFWQPSLSLGAEQTEIFDRSGTSSSGPIIDAIGDSETTIALQLRLPLYTGGSRRADETQAAEELTGLRLQRQSTIERVEQRIRSALQTARASYANIELLHQAADAALKNLELVQDSYARGVVSIVDLLDAQNSAVVSEQRASNAIYNFLKDLMELERSISRFDFFQSADEQNQWIKRLQAFFKQRSVFEQ
jgi:outer membrane protein TolC/ABC-type uncharacterized transport system substrate-binding protein